MIEDAELYDLAYICVEVFGEGFGKENFPEGLPPELIGRIRTESLYVTFKKHLEEKAKWSAEKTAVWKVLVAPLVEQGNKDKADFEKSFDAKMKDLGGDLFGMSD